MPSTDVHWRRASKHLVSDDLGITVNSCQQNMSLFCRMPQGMVTHKLIY